MKTQIILAACALAAGIFAVSCEKETEPAALAAPRPVIAEYGPGSFTVQWEPVENATEYVYVKDSDAEISTQDWTVTFENLPSGTYTVKVKAVAEGYLDSEWGTVTATLDEEEAGLSMEAEYVSDGCFNLKFTPTDNVTEIRYAVTSAVGMKPAESLAAFEDGSLEGIETVTMPVETVSIERDSIGPYMIYAKAFTAGGSGSETVSRQIMAFSGGFTVDNFDLVAMDITPTVYDENIAFSGALVVSKMVLGELGMTIEELLETYASFGMVPYSANGEQLTVALNGYEDYDYIIGVAGFDQNETPAVYGSFSMHTGFADESLPLPSPLTIEVYDITDNSAGIKFTMGENTRAYYQAVMTVTDYNDLIDYGSTLPEYDNPDDYVRDYIAVYGTTMFADDDYEWPLSPGTDYIAVGVPMNGNGSLGYGDMAKEEFSTTGSAGAPVPSGLIDKGIRTVRPLTADEIRRVLNR